MTGKTIRKKDLASLLRSINLRFGNPKEDVGLYFERDIQNAQTDAFVVIRDRQGYGLLHKNGSGSLVEIFLGARFSKRILYEYVWAYFEGAKMCDKRYLVALAENKK